MPPSVAVPIRVWLVAPLGPRLLGSGSRSQLSPIAPMRFAGIAHADVLGMAGNGPVVA